MVPEGVSLAPPKQEPCQCLLAASVGACSLIRSHGHAARTRSAGPSVRRLRLRRVILHLRAGRTPAATGDAKDMGRMASATAKVSWDGRGDSASSECFFQRRPGTRVLKDIAQRLRSGRKHALAVDQQSLGHLAEEKLQRECWRG